MQFPTVETVMQWLSENKDKLRGFRILRAGANPTYIWKLQDLISHPTFEEIYKCPVETFLKHIGPTEFVHIMHGWFPGDFPPHVLPMTTEAASRALFKGLNNPTINIVCI